MATDLPERPEAHKLEADSANFLRSCLPRGWTCDRPADDYGVDFRVGVVTGDKVTGRTFVIQLKASGTDANEETVAASLKVSTLNCLLGMIEIALLVKYVKAEDAAYWLFCRDIPEPSENQETITVRIPRANRLSKNSWLEIDRSISEIYQLKLAAGRR